MPSFKIVNVKSQTAAVRLNLENGDVLSVTIKPKLVRQVIGDDGKPALAPGRVPTHVYNCDFGLAVRVEKRK